MTKLSRQQKQEIKMLARMDDFTQSEIEQIRRDVQQGIDELDRGEGKTYVGKKGLRQLFREIREEGLKELAAERKKKTQH